jgi:hypothetical protein
VQDFARHEDPKTTRRYDNSRVLHRTGEKTQVAWLRVGFEAGAVVLRSAS